MFTSKSFFLSVLLVCSLLLTATAQRRIEGEGPIQRKTYNVSGFNELYIGSVFKVVIRPGSSEKVEIEAHENMHQYVICEVRNGKLNLRLQSDNNYRDVGPLRAYVTYKQLEEIEMSGATELTGEGVLKANDFSLDLSGATEVDLELDVTTLNLDFSGASDANLKVQAQELKVDCSGASDIDIEGTAKEAWMDLSGATTFNGELFKVASLKIEASGTSSVEIHVTDSIDADVSGISNVEYWGTPKSVNVSSSGMSSIKRH